MEMLQALKNDYPKDYRVYKWLAFVQGELDLQNGASYTKTLDITKRLLNSIVQSRHPACMTRRWMTGPHGTEQLAVKEVEKMTVGQIMVVCGICLVLVAVLLAVVGSVLLHKKKKMVLLEIEHEYR